MQSMLTSLALIAALIATGAAQADSMMVDCKILQFAKLKKELSCLSGPGAASHRSLEVFSMGTKVLLKAETRGSKSCALAVVGNSTEFQSELALSKVAYFPLSASSKLTLGHAGVSQLGSDSVLGTTVTGTYHCKI